ncbi:MAG: hypothetical protein IKM87_00885 [Clostridia bacterium]|nr:hypothetical protein [Clostridia bacterium]
MVDSKKITGTPWHPEYLKRDEEDKRRHRSRCRYYDKKGSYCNKGLVKCLGSSHCEFYEETKDRETQRHKRQVSYTKNALALKHNGLVSTNNPFIIGSKIAHKEFGTGIVTGFSNGVLVILFDNGEKKNLQLSQCIRNLSLRRIDN